MNNEEKKINKVTNDIISLTPPPIKKSANNFVWLFFKGVQKPQQCPLDKALKLKKAYPDNVTVYICEERYLPKPMFGD